MINAITNFSIFFFPFGISFLQCYCFSANTNVLNFLLYYSEVKLVLYQNHERELGAMAIDKGITKDMLISGIILNLK